MKPDNFQLDLASPRARRARAHLALGRKWLRLGLAAGGGLALLGGGYLLITGDPLGWLLLLPANVAALLLLWYYGDLAEIAPLKTSAAPPPLHALLPPAVLGRLKSENPSAQELWRALAKSDERYFLENRFLVGGQLFEQLASQAPGSAAAVWPLAEKLRQKHGLDDYSPVLLLLGLLQTLPDAEQLLRRLGLEPEELETAIPWVRDIRHKERLLRAHRGGHGVGRDWAYGYTPLLRALGRNVSASIEVHGFFRDTRSHQVVVQQMVQTMAGGNDTITLVGETGVGKTTSVYAFAKRLLDDNSLPQHLRYHQIIELDAPSIIANAKGPGQLEELVLRLLDEARRAKNIILFFDDAEAFFASGPGAVDISQILQPVLEAGAMRLVLAMSPAAWQGLSARGANARLKAINVPPADEAATLQVLRDAIAAVEHKHGVAFTYHALKESHKLGSRYVDNLAMPGAALRLLEQAAANTPGQLLGAEAVQAAVEQAYGVKLQQAGAPEADKLLNLEAELHQYMVNQERAVAAVAAALRRSRSGVGSPERPVGTFLFLGPTGVGKTELSKALARVYFGDESALIRVDMNQYVESGDVARLIQPAQGSELGFLGAVRARPFSVVLLDELEKAHSSVVNALLQLLDEGTLRDGAGKQVSFKDAIIIATSNAAADEIRKMIDAGQDIAQAEGVFVETLIKRGLFAPELINRFDEVVIFKPLTQAELLRVVDLMLGGINRTLDAQKVQVELTDAAKRWLVERGYDSRLGARPLRRMVQRHVENSVAARLLEGSAPPGGTLKLDVKDLEQAG